MFSLFLPGQPACKQYCRNTKGPGKYMKKIIRGMEMRHELFMLGKCGKCRDG